MARSANRAQGRTRSIRYAIITVGGGYASQLFHGPDSLRLGLFTAAAWWLIAIVVTVLRRRR
jgi:hypothetical protein